MFKGLKYQPCDCFISVIKAPDSLTTPSCDFDDEDDPSCGWTQADYPDDEMDWIIGFCGRDQTARTGPRHGLGDPPSKRRFTVTTSIHLQQQWCELCMFTFRMLCAVWCQYSHNNWQGIKARRQSCVEISCNKHVQQMLAFPVQHSWEHSRVCSKFVLTRGCKHWATTSGSVNIGYAMIIDF